MIKHLIKRSTATLLVLCLGLAGCVSQNTLAILTGTLGTASSAFVALEGNPALAQKITVDTAAAVAAINAFKPGTPAQNTVQVVNILIDDINLLPLTGDEAALAVIIEGTAQTIITTIESESSGSTANFHKLNVSAVGPVAHNRDQFVALWNATINANPTLSKSLKIRPHWYSVKY